MNHLGLHGPSLQDGTQDVRDDPNADATNIFDATYIMNFIDRLAPIADITIPHLASNSVDLGDDANPIISCCPGDCTLGAGSSGAGLLIVKGRLDFNATFAYRGLILIVGDGEFNPSGANVGLLGGLFVANTIDNGDGTWSYGESKFTIAGNSNFYYQYSGIEKGVAEIPMKQSSWREITRQIEPPF